MYRMNLKHLLIAGRKEALLTTGKKVKVLVVQSSPTLCDPIDCSPLGSSVHGILPARTLKWGAIPFSRGSSQPWV